MRFRTAALRAAQNIAISVITEAELPSGAAKSETQAKTLQLIESSLRPLAILDLSSDIEFIAKLAALVPPPRAHLTRLHGVFAPKHVQAASQFRCSSGKVVAIAVASATAHEKPVRRPSLCEARGRAGSNPRERLIKLCFAASL